MWTPEETDLGEKIEYQELCFTFTYEDGPEILEPEIYTVALQKLEDFNDITTISIIGNSLYGYFANTFKPTLKFVTGNLEYSEHNSFADLPPSGNLYSYSPDARTLITFSLKATATSTTNPLNIKEQIYTISLRNDYEEGKNALVNYIQNGSLPSTPNLTLDPACAIFR